MNVIFVPLHMDATLYRVVQEGIILTKACISVNYQLTLFMFFVRVFFGRCIFLVDIFCHGRT